ncbi:MAG: hypothetical protein PHG35_01665 [Dehalococcoidales bacterium]|nr:hypothetical protein [Dehalococcoidales bacterium]
MAKKKQKQNVFKKILNSLYYDRSKGGRKNDVKKLPVDKEIENLKNKPAGSF